MRTRIVLHRAPPLDLPTTYSAPASAHDSVEKLRAALIKPPQFGVQQI